MNGDTLIPLVKAAIAHVEFESIHPFSDGNGRMGRIVIPLMLEMDRVISSPCFYLSEFFEHRNTEYQDRMLAVSEHSAWTDWCVFFLDAVATQAKENNRKVNGIYSLYRDTLDFIMNVVRSDNAARVAPHLFRMAIFPTSIFTKQLVRLGAKNVYLMGGTKAVSDEVKAQLGSAYAFERLGGDGNLGPGVEGTGTLEDFYVWYPEKRKHYDFSGAGEPAASYGIPAEGLMAVCA